MYVAPTEVEEKIAELAAVVGDRGEIEIKHETDETGRTESSVIRVYNLSHSDNVEHLIAHYGFFIKPDSYRNEGVALFKRLFVDY